MLRTGTVYDFTITSPCLIKNAYGELFHLSLRCWTVLEQAVQAPISFQDAEYHINGATDRRNGNKEILLDRAATEYIVSKTNRILRLMKSVKRLSAAKGCFSLR